MGKLLVLPCKPADAAAILEEQIAAFSTPHEPFFFVLFPEGEERQRAVKRTVDWWLGDPSASYVKVVDDETGELISAAKWCIYEKPLTEAQMSEHLHVDWHADQDSNEWAEYLIHWIHDHRLKRTKGGRCCVLDMLSTAPAHQRRRAGSMLVKWGTDIADIMGVECFIEGSGLAKHLYESGGFIATPNDWNRIPVPEKWASKPEIKFYFFERPVKAAVTASVEKP